MKFEIKHRFNGNILFSIEAKSLKLAVELAINSKADLSRANLSDANLSRANLSEANLSNANLSCANLSRVNLSDADLYRANLSGADLYGADLFYANLSRANLSNANFFNANLSNTNLSNANLSNADLYRANLSGADLSNADLSCANLSRVNLSRVVGINKYITTQLYILLDQVGEIRAYKLTNEKDEGTYYGGIKYIIGETIKEKADTDENKDCSYGISVATLDWCIKEWKIGYKIKIVGFTKKDIAAIPIGSDGKFRISRCKIIKEVNLKEIGLIKK